MAIGFRNWFEQEDRRPIVFSDLDETLLHSMEIQGLKDNDSKSLGASKGVVEITISGKKRNIFPRPGLEHFLKEITKFAEVCILTHSPPTHAEKAVRALGIGHYFSDIYHTGEQSPSSLGEQFKLTERKWILVDNLKVETIEIINKLRILGLSFPELNPKDEARLIVTHAKDHFVHVKDWVPTVGEYEDYDLWRIIPKIQAMLKPQTQE